MQLWKGQNWSAASFSKYVQARKIYSIICCLSRKWLLLTWAFPSMLDLKSKTPRRTSWDGLNYLICFLNWQIIHAFMIRLCSRNKRWSFVFYSNISLPCHAIVLPLYFGCWYKLDPFSKMPIEYAWRLISRLLQINFMHDFQFYFLLQVRLLGF